MDITTTAGFASVVEDQFHDASVAAAVALKAAQASRARLYFAQAAICANLLTQYYAAQKGDEAHEKAREWGLRHTRYTTRAFSARNSIVKNIGGVMT